MGAQCCGLEGGPGGPAAPRNPYTVDENSTYNMDSFRPPAVYLHPKHATERRHHGSMSLVFSDLPPSMQRALGKKQKSGKRRSVTPGMRSSVEMARERAHSAGSRSPTPHRRSRSNSPQPRDSRQPRGSRGVILAQDMDMPPLVPTRSNKSDGGDSRGRRASNPTNVSGSGKGLGLALEEKSSRRGSKAGGGVEISMLPGAPDTPSKTETPSKTARDIADLATQLLAGTGTSKMDEPSMVTQSNEFEPLVFMAKESPTGAGTENYTGFDDEEIEFAKRDTAADINLILTSGEFGAQGGATRADTHLKVQDSRAQATGKRRSEPSSAIFGLLGGPPEPSVSPGPPAPPPSIMDLEPSVTPAPPAPPPSIMEGDESVSMQVLQARAEQSVVPVFGTAVIADDPFAEDLTQGGDLPTEPPPIPRSEAEPRPQAQHNREMSYSLDPREILAEEPSHSRTESFEVAYSKREDAPGPGPAAGSANAWHSINEEPPESDDKKDATTEKPAGPQGAVILRDKEENASLLGKTTSDGDLFVSPASTGVAEGFKSPPADLPLENLESRDILGAAECKTMEDLPEALNTGSLPDLNHLGLSDLQLFPLGRNVTAPARLASPKGAYVVKSGALLGQEGETAIKSSPKDAAPRESLISHTSASRLSVQSSNPSGLFRPKSASKWTPDQLDNHAEKMELELLKLQQEETEHLELVKKRDSDKDTEIPLARVNEGNEDVVTPDDDYWIASGETPKRAPKKEEGQEENEEGDDVLMALDTVQSSGKADADGHQRGVSLKSPSVINYPGAKKSGGAEAPEWALSPEAGDMFVSQSELPTPIDTSAMGTMESVHL